MRCKGAYNLGNLGNPTRNMQKISWQRALERSEKVGEGGNSGGKFWFKNCKNFAKADKRGQNLKKLVYNRCTK